jgi:hypothetical protein
MVAHLGGDIATEPQRMISRHVAVLDTEARYLADKIGTIRNAGGEPPEKTIDLYTRIANGQRRLLEALGMNRTPRNLNPSLGEIIEHAAGATGGRTPGGGGCSVSDSPPKNNSQNFSGSDDD